MFMDADVQRKAILEGARVLTPGGLLHIWDCAIASAYPEPFCISLDIQLPKERISTTYGVGKLGSQNSASVSRLCEAAGLIPVEYQDGPDGFHMVWKKA